MYNVSSLPFNIFVRIFIRYHRKKYHLNFCNPKKLNDAIILSKLYRTRCTINTKPSLWLSNIFLIPSLITSPHTRKDLLQIYSRRIYSKHLASNNSFDFIDGTVNILFTDQLSCVDSHLISGQAPKIIAKFSDFSIEPWDSTADSHRRTGLKTSVGGL